MEEEIVKTQTIEQPGLERIENIKQSIASLRPKKQSTVEVVEMWSDAFAEPDDQ
jgi:hypothetical protein